MHCIISTLCLNWTSFHFQSKHSVHFRKHICYKQTCLRMHTRVKFCSQMSMLEFHWNQQKNTLIWWRISIFRNQFYFTKLVVKGITEKQYFPMLKVQEQVLTRIPVTARSESHSGSSKCILLIYTRFLFPPFVLSNLTNTKTHQKKWPYLNGFVQGLVKEGS